MGLVVILLDVCRWTSPIMRKGFREKLKPLDVYQAPSQDAADVLAERLEKFVFSTHLCLHTGLIQHRLNCTYQTHQRSKCVLRIDIENK